MPKKVVILGAGGHAKVIADIILSSNDVLIGFLDDVKEGYVFGFPVIGKIDEIHKYDNNYSFVIGIGNNRIRKQVVDRYNVCWHTAIHPSAIIARDVSIAEGTVIMAGAIINPSTIIGKHCIINTGAIIEHDNKIADFVHISPNAILCGTVSVGCQTHIGAGAKIINDISICPEAIVGAGAVVVNDIIEAGTYVGVPAKRVNL